MIPDTALLFSRNCAKNSQPAPPAQNVQLIRDKLVNLHRPVSMTNQQARVRADGMVRFILSRQKPLGLSPDDNWLSNASRDRGFMILRWLDTPSDVSLPDFELARIDPVKGLISCD